jgi:hypothetical protein
MLEPSSIPPAIPVDERVPYPSDDELRAQFPVVDAFAALMRREMWANRRKGSRAEWRRARPWDMVGELLYHVAKVSASVKAGDIDNARQHVADIGNEAMILADCMGLLGDSFYSEDVDAFDGGWTMNGSQL